MSLSLKWRPKKFNDLLGQDHIINILKRSLKYNRLHNSYLFSGPSGVGKTTLARIWAKCLSCIYTKSYKYCNTCISCKLINSGKSLDYIEIDGASNRSVDQISCLLDSINFLPLNGKYKIYLIDEFHMLSNYALSLLLKILEEPPNHVKFILVTTDYDKIPNTVISRCINFFFKLISIKNIILYISKILIKEKIFFKKKALFLIAYYSKGNMRDALSLCDQAMLCNNNNINYHLISKMLNLVDELFLIKLLFFIFNKKIKFFFKFSKIIKNNGGDFYNILSFLISIVYKISLLQINTDINLFEYKNKKLILYFAKIFNPIKINFFLHVAINGYNNFNLFSDSYINFMLILIKITFFKSQFFLS